MNQLTEYFCLPIDIAIHQQKKQKLSSNELLLTLGKIIFSQQ